MSQNPLHYVREELLPHLIWLMDQPDKDYAAWSIKDRFEREPWIEREIGSQVRAAWKERFGKVAA